MKLLLLVGALVLLPGCAAYKRAAWTPDGFNYTLARDRHTGQQTDYLGLTWNLKP